MKQTAQNLDLHLLHVLCTLLSEQSVSRTAVKLNEAQPSVSRALKRLRVIFDDPLLVRGKNGMVLTERALEIKTSVDDASAAMERLLCFQQTFEPRVAETEFRIGTADFLSVVFLTDLVAQVRKHAPHCRVLIKPLTPEFDFESALAAGDLDLVISNWCDPPASLHLSVILDDQIVLLMSRNNPLAFEPVSREQYLAAPCIVPTAYSFAQTGVIDNHLASLGVERNICITLPYFSLAPYLLLNSDLIFTTTSHFAAHYTRFLPLHVAPAPAALNFPTMRFYMLWHERTNSSSAQQWFRSVVKQRGPKVLVPNPLV